MRLMDGFVTTQLLYVAAKLGVADVLVEGPRSAAELADAVGAEPDALARVLRGLVVDHVLAEADDGRFSLTDSAPHWCRSVAPPSCGATCTTARRPACSTASAREASRSSA